MNETIKKEESAEDSPVKVVDAEPSTFNKEAGVWYQKFNAEFKESKTVKLLVYGLQKNQVMIRLSNLEDHFDGAKAKSYKFDINAWSREFYLEANSHLFKKNTTKELLQGIRLNITEMNLAGSIPKSYFNTTYPQAKWIAQGSQIEKVNFTEPISLDQKPEQLDTVEKEPKDNIQFVELERAKGSLENLGTLYE